MKANLQTFRCDFRPCSLGLGWLPLLTVRRSSTGSATHWHKHDEHEIIFLVDGAVTYVFRHGPHIDLKGGEFLVIPKGVEHHILDNIDTPSFRLGFNLADDASVDAAPLTRDELALLVSALRGVRRKVRAFADTTRADLIALTRLVAARQTDGRFPPFGEVRIRLLCTRILTDCAATTTEDAHRPSVRKDDIDAAIAYIESHAEGSFDLAELVRHVGYSRSRLFSLFRRKTGLSPAAYHQRRRLEAAQRLLDTTDLTSEQVAERLGFESSTYFTYAFRRYFGVTPLAFRKR